MMKFTKIFLFIILAFFFSKISFVSAYTSPSGGVTVIVTYNITSSAGTNGTISPNGVTTVDANSQPIFVVTPNSGYTATITSGGCGGSLVGTNYTTNAILADCTVAATFSASGSAPTVTTPSQASITQTSAVLGGNVTSLGSPATLSARGINIGTTSTTLFGNYSITGSATGVFTVNVPSLTCNTLYYYKAYATNTTGTGLSALASFTTAACNLTFGTSIIANGATGTGILCGGSACPAGYAPNTVVLVTATAVSGYTVALSGTGSASSCSGTSCSVTVTSNTTVTATYTAAPLYTFTDTIVANGATGTNLTCNGGVCAASYAAGTSLSMNAPSATGYTVALSGTGCTSAGGGAGAAATCTVTMPASALTITATYTKINYTFGTSITANGATGTGITCGGSACAATYAYNTVVSVAATAVSGYTVALSGTGSASSCSGTSCSVTVTSNTTVTATYTASATAVPTITNGPTSPAVYSTSFIVYTSITSLGLPATVTDFGIKYGTVSGSLTSSLPYGSGGFIHNDFSNYVSSGLIACTKYYYQGYAINSTGTGYSPELSLTTTGCALPTLSTPTAVSPTQTSATLGATIITTGVPAYTERGVVYSTSVALPTTSNSKTIIAGSGTGAYSQSVTLSCGSTYNVRGYAINTQGTAYTTTAATVTTTACNVAPSLSAPVVSAISQTGMTVTSTITAGIPAALSARGTCWNTINSTANCLAEGGTATGSFSQARTGLTCGTSYYAFAYATNATGTGYSSGTPFSTSCVTNYNVIFNANLGTGTMANQSIQSGTSAILTTNTFTRTGYTFTGWNTLANGTGTSYANGASYLMGSANVTLYAQWSPNSCTVSPFGTIASGSSVTAYSTASGNTCTSQLRTCTAGTLSGTYAYAACTINQYTVTYNKNGGTIDASPISQAVNYNTSVGSFPTNPIRPGYIFNSWNTLSTGLGSTFATTTAVTANITVYAKWTAAPNLTAAIPTFSSPIIINAAETFSSTISNSGAATTGASFNNFYQVCPQAGGCATPADQTSKVMTTLTASATGTITLAYTFTAAGAYSVRVCADKTNSASVGVITESDEGDNCSSWLDLNVIQIPTLSTVSATAINDTTASSGGNISSDGGDAITAKGVVWATTAGPTTANSKTSDGTGIENFTSSLISLNTNTTYYYRAYATNGAGTAYGSELSFTTLALPAVSVSAATNILQNSATINAIIDSLGNPASLSERGFCWGTTATPTTNCTLPTATKTVSVLVVAGGGGGGKGTTTTTYNGGAGGAGGLVFVPNYTVTDGAAYAITVGNGGAGATLTSAKGSNGSNSVFNDLIAIGGGGGGSASSTSAIRAGASGGSGGGAARYGTSYGTAGVKNQTTTNGGYTNTGFGYNGAASSSSINSGGGGGAAAAATSAAGGVGKIYDSITYSDGGTAQSATAGGLNTGDGGGTAATNSSSNGSAGGSGKVVVHYTTADFGNCTGGVKTVVGSETFHTFASNGTFTVVLPTAPVLSTGPFSQALSGLIANTLYYFRGFATNSTGRGYSTDGTFSTLPNAPVTPVNLQVSASTCGNTWLNLSWTASVGATIYNVYRDGVASPISLSTYSCVSGTCSGSDTGLTLGSSHSYTVEAVNTGGTSAPTSSVSGTVANSCNIIPTVTTPTQATITQTTVTLGATVSSLGVPAAISARGTCWGTTANPTTNCLAEGGTTATAYTHSRTSLSPGTTYYYRGYATNTTGTGYSADGTFTTLANVPVVTLTANPTSGGKNFVNPTLTWTTTNNPTSCTASGDWSGTQTVTGGSASQGILTTVKTYSYSLVCANSGGNSNTATATVVVTSMPNLTASNVIFTAPVYAKTAESFNATITNNGAASTGVSFKNFYQVCPQAGGCATPADQTYTTMSALTAGSTGTASLSYIFPSAGLYSIRVCADKTSSAGGVITEADENDNCSPTWVDVTVTALAVTVTETLTHKTTPDSATYYTRNNDAVSMAYTSSVNNGGATSCRLLNYNKTLVLTSFQASSPIVYTGPAAAGTYGYYVQCESLDDTSVLGISGEIIVYNITETFSATDCKIDGTSSPSHTCDTTVSWNVASTIPGSPATAVTAPTALNNPAPLASWTPTTTSGSKTFTITAGNLPTRNHEPATQDFYFYHNTFNLSDPLLSPVSPLHITASAYCTDTPFQTYWNGTDCVAPVVSLGAAPCFIAAGKSSCDAANPAMINNWSITNPLGQNMITAYDPKIPSTTTLIASTSSTNGSYVPFYPLTYNHPLTLTLSSGGTPFPANAVTVEASCASHTTWDTISSTCKLDNPTSTTITYDSDSMTIFAGGHATLSWSDNGLNAACILKDKGTNVTLATSLAGATGSSFKVSPLVNTTYNLSCTNSSGTVSIDKLIKVISIEVKEQ